MVGEDLLQRGRNLRAPAHLAPIESDHLTILGERSGEGLRVARVPTLQYLTIECADRVLVG